MDGRPSWVYANLERGGAFVRPVAPAVCPGCGRAAPFHPWGCPVLVRLSAQLLVREAGGRWRGVARATAVAAAVEWGVTDPECRHWLAVAAEPAARPPAWTPELVRAEDGAGMVETTTADRVNYPGAADLLKRLRKLKSPDGPAQPPPLLRGAVVCPFIFPTTPHPTRSASDDAHAD